MIELEEFLEEYDVGFETTDIKEEMDDGLSETFLDIIDSRLAAANNSGRPQLVIFYIEPQEQDHGQD